MRSLTLAEELKQRGVFVRFICREHSGNLCDFLRQKDYLVHKLPPIDYLQHAPKMSVRHFYEKWLGVEWNRDAEQTMESISDTPVDWFIVDHYGIDYKWEENIIEKVGCRILVIDDLANRQHACDVLLDQNLYHNMTIRYEGLVPNHCKMLLGPEYALLREEFFEERKHVKQRNGDVKRILVFFGGSDPTNETSKALEAISFLQRQDFIVDVVVGNSNPNKELIAKICEKHENFLFHCQINYMAKLIAQADLAIGAGGSTTWERCSLGLPTITITTAENQMEMTKDVASTGAIQFLGHSYDVSVGRIREALIECLDNPERLREMSAISLELMGNVKTGGTARVVSAIWEE